MRVASKRVVGAGKWIQLKELEVVDAKTGRSKQWESAERTGNQTAVAIFVRLFGGPLAEGCDETLLVKQFRPPVDRYVLENPAGLVDKGESAEEAALRELEEETGYHGVVTGTTSDIYCDPGMSDASFKYVFVDCDLGDQRNARPRQRQEDCEAIEVLRVPMAGLLRSLDRLAQQHNCVVDAKCYSLALGMSLRR